MNSTSSSAKRSFQDMNNTNGYTKSVQFKFCTYCRGTGTELCCLCNGNGIDPKSGWKCMCRNGLGFHGCGPCGGTGKNPAYREAKR